MDLDRDREALHAEAPNVEEVLAADVAREVVAPIYYDIDKEEAQRSVYP